MQCWLCPGTLCNGLTEALDEHASLPAYADIESTVASSIGPIEVYKVHHHGSRYSTNSSWVTATTPKVGIISVGSSNSYGHPTGEALGRLHNAGTKTYWTSLGNGAAPVGGQDVAAGNVIVEVASGATTFTVRYGASTDTYSMWALPATPPFGTIDTPRQGETVSGEIINWGWALTPHPAGIPTDGSTVAVLIDGVAVGRPTYGLFRSDIAALFPGYANTNSAVEYFTIDTRALTNVVRTIAWMRDAAGNTQGIGSRYFTVFNP